MIRRWLARLLGLESELERLRQLCLVYGVNPTAVRMTGSRQDIDTAVRDYVETLMPVGVAVSSEWVNESCLLVRFHGRRP